METRRLFLHLASAFGMTWFVFFAYILSGNVWMADGALSGMDQFVSLGMLLPALAAFFTRWVTKEGFAVTGKDSLLLCISFRDGKWKYFVLAIILPWIYFELGYALMMMLSGTIGSFAAFGEEAGWRGYMMPKMIKLWGVKKAVIIGGVLWSNVSHVRVYGHDPYLCDVSVRIHMARCLSACGQ